MATVMIIHHIHNTLLSTVISNVLWNDPLVTVQTHAHIHRKKTREETVWSYTYTEKETRRNISILIYTRTHTHIHTLSDTCRTIKERDTKDGFSRSKLSGKCM